MAVCCHKAHSLTVGRPHAVIRLSSESYTDSLCVMLSLLTSLLPVPGLESITGPLEEVALHDHAIWCVHVEFQLGVIVRKVLQGNK